MTELQNIIIALFLLLVLSRVFIGNILNWLYRLTGARGISNFIYAVLFLPGTFVHELSHYLTSKILFVPVSKFNIWPKTDGLKLQLGSVSIAKTDLIRGTLIGTSPFILGVLIIYGVYNSSFSLWIKIIVIFEALQVMYLSASDVKALRNLVILLLIIGLTTFLITNLV